MHVPLTTDLIYHEQYTILNYQYFDNLRNLIVAAKLKKKWFRYKHIYSLYNTCIFLNLRNVNV